MSEVKSTGSTLDDVVSCASSALISAEQSENAFYVLLSRQIPRTRIRRTVRLGERRTGEDNFPQDKDVGGRFGQPPRRVSLKARVLRVDEKVRAFRKLEGVQGAIAAKISFRILVLRLSRPVFFLIFLLI